MAEGTFWNTEIWWSESKAKEGRTDLYFGEDENVFAKHVTEELHDFVCDESLNLDTIRKCFLYQARLCDKTLYRKIIGFMKTISYS